MSDAAETSMDTIRTEARQLARDALFQIDAIAHVLRRESDREPDDVDQLRCFVQAMAIRVEDLNMAVMEALLSDDDQCRIAIRDVHQVVTGVARPQ